MGVPRKWQKTALRGWFKPVGLTSGGAREIVATI